MMTKLREIRLQVVTFISKFEAYLVPAGKFITAMIVFCIINAKFGYMTKIAKFPIALILGLFCSFMPMTMIIIIAALTILLEEAWLADVAAVYALLSFMGVVVLTKIYIGVYKKKQADISAGQDGQKSKKK